MSPLWKDGDKWLNATQVAALLSVSRNTLKPLMARFIDPLPQPFPFGQSRRWLASQIWAWMERQMTPCDALVAENDLKVKAQPGDSSDRSATAIPHDMWIAEVKELYLSGTTLDVLCRQHQIGKVRLSALLRQAGTAMRRPGRRSATDRSSFREVRS